MIMERKLIKEKSEACRGKKRDEILFKITDKSEVKTDLTLQK